MKSYKNDFPILKNNKKLVYLDSAATSQKPQIVLDALMNYYKNYNANVKRGLYPIAERATAKVEEVRQKVAAFLNASESSEIIFVRNTTEAINLVMNTWGDININPDDVIAGTIMEHHSNFVPWQQLALKKQVLFEVIGINDNGFLDIKDKILNIKKAKLLAITHVSNVLGTINPLKKIIADCKKINPSLIVLVDAAQSVPHMKVDVQDLGCDFLVFSGHKMMASTGIGVLYGRKKLLEDMPPFLFGGEMVRKVTIDQTTFAKVPDKFEAGTPDISGIISLGAAIDYLDSIGMDTIAKQERMLIAYCLECMEKIEGMRIYGPKVSTKRSGIISFTIDGIHPHDIAQVLGEEGICIRAGHHCAMPLHTTLGLPATARVSFYLYNDKKDVDNLIKGIKKAQKIFLEK